MKPEPPKQSAPNSKLNIICFLLPILAIFLPVPLNEHASRLPALSTEVITGTLSLSSGIGAFLAVYILVFRPSRKIKQAAWHYLFGFALALGALIFIASWISAASPW